MPASTQEARERLEVHELAVKHGLVSADQPRRSSSIRDAIEPYLAGYAPGHQTKTVNFVRTTLNKFVAVIGTYLLAKTEVLAERVEFKRGDFSYVTCLQRDTRQMPANTAC